MSHNLTHRIFCFRLIGRHVPPQLTATKLAESSVFGTFLQSVISFRKVRLSGINNNYIPHIVFITQPLKTGENPFKWFVMKTFTVNELYNTPTRLG